MYSYTHRYVVSGITSDGRDVGGFDNSEVTVQFGTTVNCN